MRVYEKTNYILNDFRNLVTIFKQENWLLFKVKLKLMYCKLNSTGVILVINISLLLSLDYPFHIYSMHDTNR